MNRALFRSFAAFVLAWVSAAAARADYVVASRHAVVHEQPSSADPGVLDLEKGDALVLVESDQTSGYYHVHLPDSDAEGWVYRTFVRRFPGLPPSSHAGGGTASGHSTTAGASSATGASAKKFTTGTYKGCPPEGEGGDPDLNRLKNRDLPPPKVEEVTVSEMIEEVPGAAADMGRKKRAAWTAEARKEVAETEGHGLKIVGYLLNRVQKEGKEACNCGSTTEVDRHMWLADESGVDRTEAMVVEISPRLRGAHPAWTDERLNKLVHAHTKVRITGWAMWDQEHPEQVGKTRGTLWEIHPIHQIEIQVNGDWQPLDN